MKKFFTLIVILAAVGASYVYFQSQQRPTDTYVATDTMTGEVATGATLDTVVATGDESLTTTSMSVQQNSVLWWKATKPGGSHTGTVAIADGFVAVRSGMITAGEFTMDMTALKLLDMDNAKLEGEIRDDFFQAPTYPTAKFVTTKVESQGTGIMVYGNLTIKDVTQAISFPAQTTLSSGSMNVKASFAIDRLLRGLNMWEGKVNNYFEFMLDLNFSQAM